MQHKINIYSTATCPACKMAKEYIKSKGFDYTNFDVGENAKDREEMMSKNGGLISVPTIEIDGKIIVGFDKGKIDLLLGT